MDKELFKILQELKVNINMINLSFFDENIKQANIDEDNQEYLFRLYNREYFVLKLKTLVFSILTLGLYYKINKKKYLQDIEFLDIKMDEIQEDYDNAIDSLIIYQELKNYNSNLLNQYKKNYNQINNFLKLIDNLPNDERIKILDYKMGGFYE